MLTQLMHQGAGNLIEDNFRPVFKHLISCREDPDSLVRRQVFNLWTTMLSTARLVEEMENYADLILVNIFRAQRDQEREVNPSGPLQPNPNPPPPPPTHSFFQKNLNKFIK